MNWKSLNYLADENIDGAVIEFFQSEGFDIADVYQEKL